MGISFICKKILQRIRFSSVNQSKFRTNQKNTYLILYNYFLTTTTKK